MKFVPIGIACALLASAQNSGPRGGALVGTVLTTPGAPATVTLVAGGSETTVTADEHGRFRIDPLTGGPHEVRFGAAGHATERLLVTVPSGREVTLPPIRLSAAPVLRLRPSSPSGEPVIGARIVRNLYDPAGRQIRGVPGEAATVSTDADGATVVGPLERGIAELVIDAPPYAVTRLPSIRVTGETAVVDLGQVVLESGSTLHVDLVDRAGTPVAGHDVYLDDDMLFSPLARTPVRTGPSGRATFERLSAGRYRVRTRAGDRCGERYPTIARWLTIGGSGTFRERLVIGGVDVTIALTTAGAPLPAANVTIVPATASQKLPVWLRDDERERWLRQQLGPSSNIPCEGISDAGGTVTITGIPAGPARLAVRRPGSTWSRRVTVAARGGIMAVDVPPAVAWLRVVDAATRAAVAHAFVTWSGDGYQVEAGANAGGEVMLDGADEESGRITVRAPGYVPLVMDVDARPETVREVALQKIESRDLECRVVGVDGTPAAGVVVIGSPVDPLEIPRVSATDAAGVVRFPAMPRGALRLTAYPKDAAGASVSLSAPAAGVPVTIQLRPAPADRRN